MANMVPTLLTIQVSVLLDMNPCLLLFFGNSQNQRRAKQYLQQYPPDLVVLIDYRAQIDGGDCYPTDPHKYVVYYIAPQMVWWSNRRDIAPVVEITDKLCQFSGEARCFRLKGAKISWVGISG